MLLNIGLGLLVGLNLLMGILNGWSGNMLSFGMGLGTSLLCAFALGYRVHVQREQKRFQRLFEERAKE